MTAHAREVSAIRKYVQILGGVANVTHQGPGPRKRGGGRGAWATPGIPDLYVQPPPGLGPPFWVEVKVGRDTLSEAQRDFIEREVACGGAPVIVGGLNDVEARFAQKLWAR